MADGLTFVGDRDGGVCSRLSRRCRLAASILLAVGAGLLLVVALTSWGLITAVVAVIGGALIVGALPLVWRAALWTATRRSSLPTAPDAGDEALAAWAAIVGPPRPLSPGRPGAPVKRRLGAAVVPMQSVDGPVPGGGALIVHARGDDVVLTDGDEVRVLPVGRAGIAGRGTAGAPHLEPSAETKTTGRFVLFRESDGQVFLATTRLTDSW